MMESQDTTYDRASEVKAFDETKTGVKGLVEAGITKIPRIFHNPLATVQKTKPSSMLVTIPTIDIGGVFESMDIRKSVVAKVKDAVEKYGFFQAINHGIPMELVEKMIDGPRRFHGQDPEVRKTFYSRDKTKKFRYMSNDDIYSSPAASWRDAFNCLLAPDVPKPEDLPNVCGEIILEYSKEVMKLAELILELFSEALGLSSNHLKEMGCAKGLMMLGLYFPPCPEPHLTLGAAPHTDRSFLTILVQDQIGGLQVLHDGYWIDVHPNPEALIINIGDLLQLITNDKFISVEHRVLAHRSQEARISVASFFVHPPTSSIVYGPIKELLSEQNPPKYRDTTAGASNHYVARKPNENSSLSHLRI